MLMAGAHCDLSEMMALLLGRGVSSSGLVLDVATESTGNVRNVIKHALSYDPEGGSLYAAFQKSASADVSRPQNSSSDVYIVAVVEHAPRLWRSHLLTWSASMGRAGAGLRVLGILSRSVVVLEDDES